MNRMEPDTHYPINIDALPRNWKVAYLGEWIQDIRNGQANGRHNNEGEGIPHLRPMNIDRQGHIALSSVKFVSPMSKLRLSAGDVLFNNTNSPELVGKTAIITTNNEWTFSNHMTRLRPPNGLLPQFIAYQLQFLWMTGYFRYRCTQHVNQASISSRTLAYSVPLAVSPSGEQARIVAEIEKHTARLEAAEQLLKIIQSKLDNYCLLVMKKACEGSLVPNEITFASVKGKEYESGRDLLKKLIKEKPIVSLNFKLESESEDVKNPADIYQIPPGWALAKMWQVGKILSGRQRSPKNHVGPNMRPYLRVANVHENRIDVSDILEMNFTPEEFKKYKLEMNDILLNEGQSPELVGRPAIFRNEVVNACFQNTLIRFRVYHGLSPMFALIVFRHYLHTKRFQNISKWSTNLAHLGSTRFAKMDFPLPPLAEQERIVTEVERCLSLVESQRLVISSILERIIWLKQMILKRAFNGILVSQNQDEESAENLFLSIQKQYQNQKNKMPTSKVKVASANTASNISRRPLYDILVKAGTAISPQDMLRESGIAEDNIEDFYTELKHDIENGRIKQNDTGEKKGYMTIEQ